MVKIVLTWIEKEILWAIKDGFFFGEITTMNEPEKIQYILPFYGEVRNRYVERLVKNNLISPLPINEEGFLKFKITQNGLQILEEMGR